MVQQAVADLQHQDYKSAEQKLRAELRLHPNDAETLSLLGISLDEQKRFPEAAVFHKRALAIAPRSTAVLYNYANNLLASGDQKSARDLLLKAIAADPSDRNANLALTQLALERKDGREALAYLDHLKASPDIAILRLTALDLADKNIEADILFQQLSAATENNGPLSAEDGMAFGESGAIRTGGNFPFPCARLRSRKFPASTTLGVSASQAGHNERARGVLEAALRQQPKSVDALYTLALVYNALVQPEQAIRLLAEEQDNSIHAAPTSRSSPLSPRKI